MAELFGESGQTSNLALSPPNLRGIFLPAIDNPNAADGLGLFTPWGSGGTARKYKEYGPASAGSSNETQLRDLSSYFLAGGGDGLSYNFEGPAGPTGPPGPPGPAGLPGTAFGLYAPTGMLALDDTLEQIADLGTDVDQMIYTSAFEYTYTWTVKGPTEGSGSLQPAYVDCDSDMSNIVVSQHLRKIWKSTDYGDNWTNITPPGEDSERHRRVASSSDGSILALAIGNNRPFYTSVDGGVNWTARHPKPGSPPLSENWWAAATDSDGSFMVAGEYNGRLFTSTNTGVAWTERQPAGDITNTWIAAACDSDGSHVVALAETQTTKIYHSTDSGVSWATTTVANGVTWEDAACSSDGSVMVAVGQADGIYVSSDSGTTWTRKLPVGVGSHRWFSVDVSSNGKIILVGGRINDVTLTAVVSFDGGVTWQIETVSSANTYFYGAALTDDGSRGVLTRTSISGTQFIFTSVSYGEATWAETTITAFARTLVDDATAAEAATTLGLGTGNSPTFTGLTLSGLTATRLAQTNGSKALASVADLTTWVAGTANEIDIADDGDGTITIGIVDPLIVAKGGSGTATLTDHGILLGSGTDAFTALGAATNGQLPIGSTGADPVLAALTGTANRVTVTNGAGSITLSGPQDIHTAADPTFAGLNITSAADFTANSIIFQPAVDSTTFFQILDVNGGMPVFIVDSTNEFVGIGTDAPLRKFHLYDSFGSAELLFERGDQGVDQKRFNIYIASNKVFFRALNDAGNGGLDWLYCTHSTGEVTLNYSLVIEQPLFITESAAASADRAGKGQIWIKNTIPNEMWFTDDVGTDIELSHNLTTDIDHDALTNFVANEHIDHSTVSILAGTGMSGGGDITTNKTLDCTITQYTDEMVDDRVAVLIQNGTGLSWTYDDVLNTLTGNVSITQYTDELAQDAVGTILTDSSSIDFTYNDVLNTITAAVLPAGVDHDALLNFATGEHFLQTAITNVSSALATGLLKVTTGTGALSVITDSSANWDSAYTHSQIAGGNSVHVSVAENSNWDAAYTHVSSTGNDHTWLDQDVTTGASPTFAGLDLNESIVTLDTYTKLLLHFDNVDASTTIGDSSFSGHTITVVADAQIDTAQSKFGGASLLLDGTGDYISLPDNADWTFGSGDFTIDFWIRPTIANRQAVFAGNSDQWLGIDFHNQGTRNITIWASSTGSSWDLINADPGGNGIGTISLALDEWSHVVYIRNGNNWRTYINGVVDVDVTVAGTLVAKNEIKNIGRWGGDLLPKWNGWIDEFRISKGIARWTSGFTPPVKPYGDGTFGRIITSTITIKNIKSGATQGAAGAIATELWKTTGHATLPDNVIMIGV